MYSVVLVSAAKQVTEAFNSLDLWEGQEFSLVLVTNSIEEAFAVHPNVIICPAKSSFLDGSEIARKVYDEDLNIKVVLYGRKTYDYLKLAVNSRAWGYISMPLERTEFVHLLINLHQYIEKDNKNFNPSIEDEDINTLREFYFYNLLSGKAKGMDEAYKGFERLRFDVNPQDFKSMLVKITIDNFNDYLDNKWKYGKDSLYTAANNFITKTERDVYIIPVHRKQNEIYVVAFGFDKLMVDSHFAKIKKNMKEIMGMDISFILTNEFNNIKDIIEHANNENLIPKGNSMDDELDIGEDNKSDEKTVIYNSKEYINNCFNKEICLDDVASFVCLSSAYFSRLFKHETGENFIDYLVKVRMENAKKYLQTTNYKTYEISQMVGYKKSKYFSKLFKNYTGYTPTEYRVRINRRKQSDKLKSF